MKWNKGTAGEKEAKADRVLLIFFAVLSVILLLFQKVDMGEFNDFYRAVAKGAPSVWKAIGFILTLGSVVPLYFGTRYAGETKNFKIAWGILLVLGWFCSAGWYEGQY